MMIKLTTLLCTLLLAVSAQPPSPFFSYSSGGPPPNSYSGGPSSSPFRSGGPPSSSPFGSGGPSSSSPFGSGGPSSSSPFGSGGPSPFSSGGPPSFSSFNGGQPGRPGNRPGGPKGPPPKSGNKLFSWIGNTMSKLQGLGPKITYHSTKPKQHSQGGPSHGSSSQNSPPFFSSGGPPRGSFPDIPNSLFEDGPSPFGSGGSTVTYSSPNSVDHSPVFYRKPSGPSSSGFGPRPGPPPPSFSSRPSSFGSRPPPSYSSGGPPPSYSSGGPPPSYSSGGPPPSYTSGGPPPSYSSGGPPPSYSSGGPSPFGSSRPPFGRPPPRNNNNLEVFPSQQISYQSQTLSQNEPGYDDILGNPQSLYSSQSNSRPSYQNRPSNYEQQESSYSQNQPQVAKGPNNNYGASFHSIEPVKVAPVYDVNQHFQASSSDMSGAYSNVQQQRQQQPSNIHDTPFETIVNDYAAQADAVTAGSEQMVNAVQNGPDMATSASTNQAFSGMQIMGQATSPEGNPMFEVVADANAPTYDGHPVDLNKLISMIEPGAQIDTMPSYGGDSDMGASDHQHVYADPSSLETESDAAMASGIMSGNKAVVSGQSQTQLNTNNIIKINYNNINDQLHAIASESRPTVVKLDGTRLNDEKLIKEHFDKEIMLDDLQENKDHGFIIVGVNTDNDTGDEDEHLHDGTNKTWTMIDTYDNNSKNKHNDDDDLLAIVQQLRNSASSELVDRFKNDLTSAATTPIPTSDNSTTEQHISRHPNHNYYPELSPTRFTLEKTIKYDSNETRTNSSVINPIFDSIKPTRYDDDDEAANNNSSILLKSDHQDDIDDDDNQFHHDDDLIMTDDDEMVASGSRNVKSVAIIVTPPPNYVKIKNKYTKAITPLSSLTSSTTTEISASTIDLIETPIPSSAASSSMDDDAISESLSINRLSSSNPGGQQQHNQTVNKDHQSSISTENNSAASSLESIDPLPNSGNNKDSISNISTISSGMDVSQFSNNGNGELESRSRKAPRYPVYRGKTSA